MPSVDWSLWPIMVFAWLTAGIPTVAVQYHFWKKDRDA